MSTSTVPLVLPALFQRAEQALPGWQVIDGPPLNNLKQKYALIGHNAEGASVETEQSISDYAITNSHEAYNIFSQFVAWSGGNDFTEVRASVYDALSTVSSIFEDDPSLGETCMLAQLTSSALMLTRGNNRVQAALTWVTAVQATRI